MTDDNDSVFKVIHLDLRSMLNRQAGLLRFCDRFILPVFFGNANVLTIVRATAVKAIAVKAIVNATALRWLRMIDCSK